MKKTNKKVKNAIPISVFIITKDEEDRISYAIQSVSHLVNEIVIVDSGSVDKTIEVAKGSGATKVISHEWEGYGPQKAYAESLCKNNWVLNIDADEIVSPALVKEITNLATSGKIEKFSAYKLAIKIIPRFGKPPLVGPQDVVVRLYDKTKATYSKSKIHDSVIVHEGEIGMLKNKVLHNCFRSYSHAIAKINMYTSMQAEDLFKKGKCPSKLRVLLEPFWTFLKAYILNRYIFLGFEGITEARIYSFAKTLRLIKAREKFLQAHKG